MLSKYVDHLPLYRQRQQFSRVGVEISGSTVDNWIRYTSDLIQPLYDLYRERVLSREYLMVDETPIKVMDREKKGKTHQGYFWVYYDPLDKEVLFNYHPGRSRASPNKLLKDFQGYLQTDGYTVYDEIGSRQGITLLHCWAHARRYFVKAEKNHRKHSEWMLEKIQSLYKIERRIKGKEPEECYKVRQSESLPVLNEIKIWLDRNINEVIPKSSLGKAFGYLLGHWKGLTRYIEDGRLQIDNNPIENTIRPVALGRKNYLFAGSHAGANRSAMIYTIVLNAKIHDIDPFIYLKELISRISNHPYKKLHELLPVPQEILLNNLK